MFNWTTTTLINELPFINDSEAGKLRIGKHLFEKRWVESIRKAEGHDFELCESTIDLTKVNFGSAKVARLYIYVGLEGSEESIYANDWYRKGMPLSVSFNVDGTATTDAAGNVTCNGTATMAEAIVDTIKRFNVFTKVKKVLDVTDDGNGVLTIKGTHEHQRLQKIQILVDAGMGEETAIVDYEMNRKETVLAGTNPVMTVVSKGVNGFGTHSQLLKDLRLPTAVHNHWLSVQKDEMPIVGAIYTQYIINYYAPSTANPSFTAVGNRSMSETTHVFWVKSDLVDAWEAKLAQIDPEGDNDFETINVTRSENPATKKYNNKKASTKSTVDSLVGKVTTLETEVENLKNPSTGA